MSGLSLADSHDGLICDLDGVVIAGQRAIDHAVDSLNALDVPVVYATNNASRTAHDVGSRLRAHGVEVGDEHVLTSAQAAARVLAARCAPGSRVLAVGGDGVSAAVREVGLAALRPGDDGDVQAVLQGYGPDVTASDLAAVAHAVRGGAAWVVTNDDLTLPTERGAAPGNGALVGAVRHAVDVDPDVVGKPHAGMYLMATRLLDVDGSRVLAVGDRLETDVQGAVSAGMPAALVLTGVHGVSDAAAAPAGRRPTYVLADLRGLREPYPAAAREGGWAVRGRARARLAPKVVVEGDGMDATRALLDVLWSAIDTGRLTPEAARAVAANR